MESWNFSIRFNKLVFAFLSAFLLSVSCRSVQTGNPYTFVHQGQDRSYYFYLPDNILPQRPLIFLLHGYTGCAESECPQMVRAALDAGYAICVPQGALDARGNSCWNVGYPFQDGLETDDVDFICSLACYLQNTYNLGVNDTFVTGMSNGGEMCYLLAYLRSDHFSAFAPIAGLTMKWMADSLVIKQPVNLMEVHGTNDSVSMWEGDPFNTGGWGAYLAVFDAVNVWAEEAGCCDKTIEPFGGKVLLHSFLGGEKEVLLYEVTGGDHSWSMHSMDTPAAIISFFNRHLSTSGTCL